MLKTSSFKSDCLPLLGLTLVAFALRMLFIGHKCFWADEGITWFITLREVSIDAPAVYKYLFGWGIELFGKSELAGRFTSAMAGTLTVPVIYFTGRRFFNERTGFIAAAITAISPYMIPISQEMRIYGLLGFELAAGLYCFLHILEDEKPSWWWGGMLAAGVIGQYTHCFFIFVLFFFGVMLLIFPSVNKRRKVLLFIGLGLAVSLLYFPQLNYTVSLAGERKHFFAEGFSYFAGNVYKAARAYFCFLFGDYTTNLPEGFKVYFMGHYARLAGYLAMTLLWVMIIPSAFYRFLKNRGNPAKVVLTMIPVFTVMFVIIDVSTARHLIFIYIPLVFIIASLWESPLNRRKIALAGVFVIFCALSLVDYYKMPYFSFERADFRSAGHLLKEEVKGGDAVLIFRDRCAYYTLKFYYENLPADVYYRPHRTSELPADKMGLEWWNETPFQEKVNTLLVNHQRVWLVESENKRWDEGGVKALRAGKWDFGPELRVRLYLIP